MRTKLMKMEYFDLKAETRLETYADTVVVEKEGNMSCIAAVRFGGYPESVKGMSDAIYGGGSVTVEIDGKPVILCSRMKQYRRELSHDGIYAEATLIIRDGEVNADNGGEENKSVDKPDMPRKCYLFCEQGDRDRLFEELDKKTGVPLIPEFKKYVLSELQDREILKPLQVISCREKFDVWVFSVTKGEENVISVMNDGLKSGAIAIPGSNGDKFPAVRSVTQYLDAFGVMIAERIKNQFRPLSVTSPRRRATRDSLLRKLL